MPTENNLRFVLASIRSLSTLEASQHLLMAPFALRLAFVSTAAAFAPLQPSLPGMGRGSVATSLRRAAPRTLRAVQKSRGMVDMVTDAWQRLPTPARVPRAVTRVRGARWRRALRVLGANAVLAAVLLFSPTAAHAKGGGDAEQQMAALAARARGERAPAEPP